MDSLKKFTLDASTSEALERSLKVLNDFMLGQRVTRRHPVAQVSWLFRVLLEYHDSDRPNGRPQLAIVRTIEEAERHPGLGKSVDLYLHQPTPASEVVELYFVWHIVR